MASMKTLTAEQFDNLKFMAELLADIRTMIANNNYDADKRARVLDGAVCEAIKSLYDNVLN